MGEVGAEGRSSPPRLLQWSLLAAPLVAFVLPVWSYRNVIDDGFIYLRIVHQVTAGNGPVYNVGERVEAFTSPLWLAILSAADLLTPVRLEWLAVILGMAATFAGMVLAMMGAARLVRLTSPNVLLVPFGVIVLVAVTAMWFYASSGLETGLAFLWLGGCLWILSRWTAAGRRLPRRWAIVLGLGWLVRPELTVYSVAFLAVVLALQWKNDTWRHRTRLLVAALALPAAYQLFRMGYYASLVANTAIAKEATHMRWERGWRYFTDFVSSYWLAVPLLVLLAGGWVPLGTAFREARLHRGVWVLAAFVGAGALNAVYVIAFGGDYEHARLLLPSLFALCAPVAVIPFTRRYVAAVAMAPWAVAAAVALRPPPTQLGTTFALPRRGAVTTDELGWGPNGPKRADLVGKNVIVPQNLGVFTGSDLPIAPSVRQPVALTSAAGVMPYALGNDLYVLDLLGLADPMGARLQIPLQTAFLPYPGHEKELPRPWIAARLVPPGTEVQSSELPGDIFALIPETRGAEFDDQIKAARAALQCPALQRLRRSTTGRLTPARFLSNIFDSFANTQLRISPDPEIAYRTLCEQPASRGSLPIGRAGTADAMIAFSGAQVEPSVRAVTFANFSLRPAPHARVVSVAGFV